MRIGLDVRALQTQDGSSTRGIGRYITDLLEGLLAFSSSDQIVLLALQGRPLPKGWSERCEIVGVEGLIYSEMPKPWYMKLPKLRSNQALLGRLHWQAVASQRSGFEAAVNRARLDVLHLPTAVDVGSYVEGDFEPPIVATFLDAIPLVHREMYYDVWGRFAQRHYDRQLADLKKAACVVAISEASRQDAIRYTQLPPERVRVVYPSIPPVYDVPVDTRTVRERYGLTGAFVLFCSIPDLHKNPERVVKAFAAVRADLPQGTRLAFVSPLEAPYEERLRTAALECGLNEAAYTITGRIPEDDLVALFQSASCLASPSLIEGFGLPAAQALAAGTPPIVSCRGSQPEIVGDAGLVVDPESVNEIGHAMVRLLNDAELREDLVRKGRERARLFLPERQAREIRAIYAGVVR